ncbi:MAG: glycosyltransferase family 9 protein [Candidatus Glassbacteria bacterium]
MNLLKRLELLNKKLWRPPLRLLFRNKPKSGSVKPEEVRKILILRLDQLGDMIVSTPLFRALKRRLPGVEIGVFGGPDNLSVIQNDGNITWTYGRSRNPLRTFLEAMKARKERYDVLLNLNLNPSLTGGIIANLAAPSATKVMGMMDASSRSFYNIVLGIERDYRTPMVCHMLRFLEVFGISAEREDRRPYIVLGKKPDARVERFMADHGLRRSGFIVLNPFAGGRKRDMGKPQAREVASQLSARSGMPTVILWAPGRDEEAGSIAGGGDRSLIIKGPSGCSILETASLISHCLFVISPDTSIVHIADAVGKPVVAMYSRLVPSFREWYPQSVTYRALYADRYVCDLPPASITAAACEILDEFQSGRQQPSIGK